jgi:Zn-dependent peptidase ImmA (M78 family)
MIDTPWKLQAFDGDITIEEEDLSKKHKGEYKGYWDNNSKIVIDRNLSEEEKFEVLLHELIHLTENTAMASNQIKRRPKGYEEWVSTIAYNLAYVLVKLDMINPNIVNKEKFIQYWQGESAKFWEQNPELYEQLTGKAT